ncbi:hypothetical protein Bca4012_064787 [Brassica carinata]
MLHQNTNLRSLSIMILSAPISSSFTTLKYLVIESLASEDEIGGLRKRMDELLTQFDCSVSSIFSTKNQKNTTYNYFFERAEKSPSLKINFLLAKKGSSRTSPLLTPVLQEQHHH